MKQEQSELYYDEAFRTRQQYGLTVDAEHSWHSELYSAVEKVLDKKERIIELGCGTGQFAQRLLKEKYNYVMGLDFSEVGIVMSSKRCKADRFHQINLYNLVPEVYAYIDTILILEVLEHLERDIEVISVIPSGKRFVGSIPKFDDTAHVRYFTSLQQVEERYSELFSTFNVIELERYFIIEAVI
jgi:2-polyprenyl-3-methyl-5-hydroxy-6-metoxy-1,4-benzoquinol methylase